MIRLSLYHLKGGVGKTTALVNLAYLAAKEEQRTLICDLDTQGSASYYLRVKPKSRAGAKGLVSASKTLHRAIKGTDYPLLDILPADMSYRKLDIALNNAPKSRKRLEKLTELFRKEYDTLFFDCPPTIDLEAENIFGASDTIIVPLEPSPLSVQTFERMLLFMKKKSYPRKKVHIFFSKVDRRKRLHQEIMAEIRQNYPRVFNTIIPNLASIERMAQQRAPIAAYAPNSSGAMAYHKLWEEVQLSARG